MPKSSEEISRAKRNIQGKTDANLANDSEHLGGIPADEYATQAYVQQYHDTKESAQKNYIDQQDQSVLNQAKEYTNSQIRNQDFSSFAKVTDIQALDKKLSEDISAGDNAQKTYTDQKIQAVVNDVNSNFNDVESAISQLDGNVDSLFTSVSNGKAEVAEAITDKGVSTSATDSFSTMASNIRSISSGGGSIDPNFVNTSDATATADKIASGYTAYAKGQKLYGTLGQGGDATPYDILQGKTAWVNNQLIEGVLTVTDGKPSYSIGDVEKVYSTAVGTISRSINPMVGQEREKIALLRDTEKDVLEGRVYINYDGATTKIRIESFNENSTDISEYTLAELNLTNIEYEDLIGLYATRKIDWLTDKGYNLILLTKDSSSSNSYLNIYIYEITEIAFQESGRRKY